MSLSLLLRHLARLRATRYPTRFGTARVYETRLYGTRMRVLDVEGSLQSATLLGVRWCELPFPYLNLYDRMFDADLAIRDVCVLGGGGYAYPKHLVAHHHHVRMDVVEIDPEITQIARRHFYLDELEERYGAEGSGRLRITHQDALGFLAAAHDRGRTYDAILNDCFAAGEPDGPLASSDALGLVRSCLADGGLYLANVVSALEGPLAESLMALVSNLSTAFEHVWAVPCDRAPRDETDNIMVIASQANHRMQGAMRLYDACP